MSKFPQADARLAEIDAEYWKIKYPSLLVHEARATAGRTGDSEMVYGTTPGDATLELLDFAQAKADDIFYDLGCGLGVPTIVASLVCKRSTGIELLPEIAAQARAVAEALKLTNASFVVGDLKSVDVSDGTIIYCYSTCLREESRAALGERVALCKRGTRILTVTHGLTNAALELEERREIGWEGRSRSVYLYVRR
jgi:SAM-dependent methyltransferase